MSESKQEFLRGTPDMLILKVVARDPCQDYAIAQGLQQIPKELFQVHQGSLDPALHGLEDKGWLEAEWKEFETGRQAKFCALTRKGCRQMAAEVLNGQRAAVGLIRRAEQES